MTKEQFDNTMWHSNMRCRIDGDLYDVISVDLEAHMIGVEDEDDGTLMMVPCKFVELENN